MNWSFRSVITAVLSVSDVSKVNSLWFVFKLYVCWNSKVLIFLSFSDSGTVGSVIDAFVGSSYFLPL
ncbi:hypothetical protein NW072_02465 [Mycoplasmopsis felis]|uniref:hypothetical protein n=1 Tax=Mycoplasmopsis felis TaxID=33923 RepID=UPI0021AF35ED|nr:hypothetical protein [Mycoplasmopsis felis]UWV79986.1 hypothetical protein NW072_02465 [Mycoplasmopsis felis]